MLAALDARQLGELYHGEDADLPRLHQELSLIRQHGFAVNEQATEAGVSAVGVALPGPGEPPAALSLAIPAARFHHDQLPAWVSALTSTAVDIQRDFAIRQAAPAMRGHAQAAEHPVKSRPGKRMVTVISGIIWPEDGGMFFRHPHPYGR